MKAYQGIFIFGLIVEVMIIALFVDVRFLSDNKRSPQNVTTSTISSSTSEQLSDDKDEGATFGLPRLVEGDQGQIISRKGYTLSFNKLHLLPNWVAYELTKEETKGQVKRDLDFYQDPDVVGAQAQSSDYSHSGWDRGHMAPAGDMKWSEAAMRESCYFSNICPQNPGLNSGAWRILEEKCRSLASLYDTVHVVCGPIIKENRFGSVGNSNVTVPDAFFKILLIKRNDNFEGIGFYFLNETADLSLKSYHTTIDDIENISGLDFFPNLPDSLENRIESTCALSFWHL